jgi:uncharacterized membrane protein
MAELVVLGFKDMVTADEAVKELEMMQSENLIALGDWARVIRKADGKIDVKQAVGTASTGAAGGALWGMLIGLLFLIPIAGLVVGAATGALMGKLSDYGIDDKFIKGLSEQIEPGTSALFLQIQDVTTDKVVERMQKYQPTVLRTSLSQEAEDKLRAAMEAA